MRNAFKMLVVAGLTLGAVGATGAGEVATNVGPAMSLRADRVQLAQAGRSCKAARTCQEAVAMWCGGYSRADADGDGIPCENVCRSLSQVEAIKKDIDC